jgi:hypothetical protein
MIALVAALSRSHAKRIDRESSAANTAADEPPSPRTTIDPHLADTSSEGEESDSDPA